MHQATEAMEAPEAPEGKREATEAMEVPDDAGPTGQGWVLLQSKARQQGSQTSWRER